MGAYRNFAFHVRAALLVGLFLAGSLTLIISMMSSSTVPSQKSSEVCKGVHEVDQIIFVLVDALRPDFAIQPLEGYYSKGVPCAGTPPSKQQSYRPGSLKYIEESLRLADHPSMGFIAVGDSPTTTFQRLKAIVSGTTPAFLEAGGNIATDELSTDNLVYHLKQRSVLLGDDTWLNLIPNDLEANKTSWKKVVPYSPFNVSDFDSNDAVVMQNIFPTLSEETKENAPKDYAKLVIAHFLGVDHIGHRMNADTPVMDNKLNQIDSHIRDIAAALHRRETETRTLMLVFGDHGMTNGGDHGGDSFQETDTFLYAEFIDSSSRRSAKVDRARAGALARERWRQNLDEDLARLALCSQTARIAAEKFGAVLQVDMTASVAALLGIPIPFSSFGRVIPELVALVDPEADIEALEECNWRQINAFFESEGGSSRQGAPWLNGNLSARERIAKLSHYERHSRNDMQTVGMFVGSVMVLTAALSSLLNREMLQCIYGENLLGACAMVIFLFRACTVFANSFIVKEDVEVLFLLQIMLLICLLSRKGNGRATVVSFLVISALRVVVPLLCRSRSHITHLADMTCGLQDLINTLAPKMRLDKCSIFLGVTAFFCTSHTVIQRMWAILLGVVVSFAYQKPLLHHILPMGLFAISNCIPNGATLRFMTFVVWTSTLCNENFVAGCAIVLYGAVLLFVVRISQHVPAVSQAVLLHVFAWVGFYSQGNHCLFNALDLNASLVGLTESNLVYGGIFVAARAFNAFLLSPMAVLIVNRDNRTKGLRVCYLVLSLAVVQASLSCFNSYIQKSHLMLFSIFAPKTIFDVTAALMTAVGYAFGVLLTVF